jgi:hypothetical protein
MGEEPSSPLPSTLNLPTGSRSWARPTAFEFSSDPLGEGHLSQEKFSATTHRPPFLNRKRTDPPARDQGQEPRTKEPKTIWTQEPQDPQDASLHIRSKILEARDLLLQACSLTKSREEQSRLLDLLEVFREYTEKGKLYKTSNIIASQVANLESATRKIEAKAKALANIQNPTQKDSSSTTVASTGTTTQKDTSFASVASAGTTTTTTGTQDWTVVTHKTKALRSDFPITKPKKSNRLILVKSPTGQAITFSPLALRNAFNKAFLDKGVEGPVVTSVSKSLGQNLIVTTTSPFSADYLLENQTIWEHLVSFQLAQKDEPWHKVVLHGIPTLDFNTPSGMTLIIEEIKTFNKGLNPIGTPYWLTSADKRVTQRAGSVVIAFATAEEANRAIRHRLYIAGISVRVEKLYSTASTTQCYKCQGFGHLDSYCRYTATCRLCGEKHATQQHVCKTCNAKGTRCLHLVPKCTNCKEAHTADNKSCETLLAIKIQKSTPLTSTLPTHAPTTLSNNE